MDRTTEFDVNGVKVKVSALPPNTREMVAMFDKMREEISEVAYRQNVLMIAIGALNANILKDAQDFLNPPEPQTEEVSDEK